MRAAVKYLREVREFHSIDIKDEHQNRGGLYEEKVSRKGTNYSAQDGLNDVERFVEKLFDNVLKASGLWIKKNKNYLFISNLRLCFMGLYRSNFGKYGSMYEANQACMKWRSKSGRYKSVSEYLREPSYLLIRSCSNEEATNKILGREDVGIKAGLTYTWDEFREVNEGRKKVIRRFKY